MIPLSAVSLLLATFTTTGTGMLLFGSKTARDIIAKYSPSYLEEDIVPIPYVEKYLNFVVGFLLFNLKLMFPIFILYTLIFPVLLVNNTVESYIIPVFISIPLVYLGLVWLYYCTEIASQFRPDYLHTISNQSKSKKESGILLVLLFLYAVMVFLSALIGYLVVFFVAAVLFSTPIQDSVQWIRPLI
jgi:hypothetical protein